MTLKIFVSILKNLVWMAIGFFGASFGMSLILGRSINPISWTDVMFILVLFIVMILSIFIHELGHLFFGFATGYKFNSFQVGNLLWFKENGKIRFRISENSFVAGQCLMEPIEDEEGFKYFWYNFGGGFFNLLVLTICLLIMGIGNVNEFWYNLLIAGSTINGFYVLINWIPISFLSNDGYNIYTVSKSKDAKRGFHKILLVNSALNKGKSLREFSAETFKVEEGADLENIWIVQLVLHEYSRLEALGDIESAMKELQRLNVEKLPTLFQGVVKLELINHYVTRELDYELAKELYECKAVKKSIKLELPGTTRVQAAYTYFVKGEKLEGKTLFAKAEKQAKNLTNKGLREMELEELERLKALME